MIGFLPSFEGRFVVAEKFRLGDAVGGVVWKAGTRKPGRVTGEAVEGEEDKASALPNALLPVLEASIFEGELQLAGGRVAELGQGVWIVSFNRF